MSKKFTNQYCVHCLKYFEELTEDHIFPKSWYPDSTPQDMEKWVVPACFECNNKLGKIEDELYKKIAICLDGNDTAASGVSEKAIRMLIPSFAKTEESKKRKEADLRKILNDSIYVEEMPNGVMKNFGPRNVYDKSMVVHLSGLDPFAHKIVRGLEFKLRGRLIGTDRKIATIHPVNVDVIDSELAELNIFLETHGVEINRGPGFIVRNAEDAHGSALYHVVIWGKFEMWIAVSTPI